MHRFERSRRRIESIPSNSNRHLTQQWNRTTFTQTNQRKHHSAVVGYELTDKVDEDLIETSHLDTRRYP